MRRKVRVVDWLMNHLPSCYRLSFSTYVAMVTLIVINKSDFLWLEQEKKEGSLFASIKEERRKWRQKDPSISARITWIMGQKHLFQIGMYFVTVVCFCLE